MQIISGITRQTTQGARQTVATVGNMVRLSEQLNEALAQFRSSSARSVDAAPAAPLVSPAHAADDARPVAPVGALR